MKEIKFNINHKIKVKITDYGKQKLLEKYGQEYYKSCINSYIDKDGYFEVQLWVAMEMFGEFLFNGTILPLETEIVFIVEEN